MDISQKIQEYTDYALTNGALHAVYFTTDQIVFDERTLLKCAFGCDDYGKGLTCPSAKNFLGLDAYKRMLQKYKCGIIIHCDNKHQSQQISLAIESRAFTDGFYWAFSLSDCALCPTCMGNFNKPCAHPKKARPAFHSVGIDVFKTVHQLNLPLATLSSPSDPQNWYSAIFID